MLISCVDSSVYRSKNVDKLYISVLYSFVEIHMCTFEYGKKNKRNMDNSHAKQDQVKYGCHSP